MAIRHKPNLAGHLVMWATKLRAFNIRYVPQTVMKSQVIADFIVEFSVALKDAEKEAEVYKLE